MQFISVMSKASTTALYCIFHFWELDKVTGRQIWQVVHSGCVGVGDTTGWHVPLYSGHCHCNSTYLF